MAGSAVIQEITHTVIQRIRWTWTSDAAGAVNGTLTGKRNWAGQPVAFRTDPGAAAPTDNYDVEIRDADGVDILNTLGGNRDTITTETVFSNFAGAALLPICDSTLELVISNAGNAKEGVIWLWISRG